MAYATKTKVLATKTKQEIEALVMKRKASRFASVMEEHRAVIAFELNERRLIFRLPLPKPRDEQDVRSRWRGLLLCLKAKFESIDRGTETFDEAFLSHVMMPDGKTVSEHLAEPVKLAYAGQRDVPLLPDFT